MYVLMANKRTEKGIRMTSVPIDQAAQNTARTVIIYQVTHRFKMSEAQRK